MTEQTRVVDLGGYAYYWRYFHPQPRITIVNLEPPAQPEPGVDWVIADGCKLPFRDGAFDIAFSNSVVEHIPSDADRRAYAAETMRVGRAFYVQTPYRWFPVEPHLMTPLIHFLPRAGSARCCRTAPCGVCCTNPRRKAATISCGTSGC